MKITFDFENCFGIKKLNEEIEFKAGQPAVVIYAPNGMMKTSFANTCAEMAKVATSKPKRGRTAAAEKDPICDRLDLDLPSVHTIKIDGNEIEPECIFVANPDQTEFNANKQVTDFLASQALKDEYDRIVGLLEQARKEFVNAVGSNGVSQSSDCDKELAEAFLGDENAAIYGCIELIAAMLRDNSPYYDVKFDDIFDDKGAVKVFLDENQGLLDTYATQYNQLLRDSDFFHVEGDKSFGTYQAAQLGKAFKDEEYFAVQHKLVLRNTEEITSAQAYNQKIKDEKDRILNDDELKKTFEAITKKVEANGELRSFSKVITNHPEWIPKLADYDGFRKEVLIGYVNHPEVRGKFDALKQVYTANKADLERVVAQARQEQDHWREIVDIFNLRFHSLPFVVRIENQENVLLQQEEAKLVFEYVDGQGRGHKKSKEELLNILSNGERRAFVILQFLFAIEARKNWDKMSLLVMDDISDSFDYQNKYAIIEYVNELAEDFEDKFKIVLLTHNFDFYRTIGSRLGKKVKPMMAVKDPDETIRINVGKYVGATPFDLEMKNGEKDSNLIALIPFVRNLLEFEKGTSSEEFIKLTGCLHLMSNTETITDTEVCQIIETFKGRKFEHEPRGERMIDIIYKEADAIEAGRELHELFIEDKIVLSVAIRITADKFLKKELLAAGKSEEEIHFTDSQTSKWIKIYKKMNPPKSSLMTVEKVNMMTPEFIHLNSFMYEPLVDMSVWHLIDLYKEVKALLGA